MITVRLFARLREQLGSGSTELDMAAVAPGAVTIAAIEVRAALAERYGQLWHELLSDPQVIVAVNQVVADWQTRVGDGDEVAFFPPVTGG